MIYIYFYFKLALIHKTTFYPLILSAFPVAYFRIAKSVAEIEKGIVEIGYILSTTVFVAAIFLSA